MRFFLIGFVAISVAGCALPIPLQIASWAASGISYATTGKSVSDHAFSAVASRDCAVHRVLFGEDMCADLMDPTEGTAIALRDPTTTAPTTPSSRLRDSLVTLATNTDDGGLQPASRPDSEDATVSDDTETPINDALLAVADTLNDIKPASRPDTFTVALETGQHYLVIGRFNQLSEAESSRDRHANLNTVVRMVIDEGNLLFQVTAGPFSRPDAQDLEATFAAKGMSSDIALLCADRATPAPCDESHDDIAIKPTTRHRITQNIR